MAQSFLIVFFLEINLILRDVYFHHAVYRPRLYQCHVFQDAQFTTRRTLKKGSYKKQLKQRKISVQALLYARFTEITANNRTHRSMTVQFIGHIY